jgi:hypothetical protein
VNHYAQGIISTLGKQDGLTWHKGYASTVVLPTRKGSLHYHVKMRSTARVVTRSAFCG